MGKKISELDRAASLNNGDLFVLSQVDAQAETGYKSVSTPVSDAAQKILKGIEFPTDLKTDDKTVIGAVNENTENLTDLTEFCKKTVPITYTGSLEATAQTAISSNTPLVNVNIENGKSYTFNLQANGIISLYHLYANGAAIKYNCVPNTEYQLTASNDLTTLSIYVIANNVIGSGTVTAVVKSTTSNPNTLEGKIDYIYPSVTELQSLLSAKPVFFRDVYEIGANLNNDGNATYIYKTIPLDVDSDDVVGIICDNVENATANKPFVVNHIDSENTVLKTDYFDLEDAKSGITVIPEEGAVKMTVLLYPSSSGGLTVTTAKFYNINVFKSPSGRFTIKDDSVPDPYNVPAYYFRNSYLNNKIDTIEGLMKAAEGNYASFIFCTDQHWRLNAKQSPKLMNYICRCLAINKLFMGGDYSDGINLKAVDAYKQAFPGKTYDCIGNHEYMNYFQTIGNIPTVSKNIDGSDIWAYINMKMTDASIGSFNRNYYFVDDPMTKTRFIVLSVYEDDGNAAKAFFEPAQKTWLQNVALDMPAGYTAVIFAHFLYSVNYETGAVTPASTTSDILDVVDSYSGSGEIACLVAGHTHIDGMTSTPGGIPVFITTCDKYLPWTVDGVDQEPWLTENRELGTITEQAFDVVVVDKTNKLVSFVRIGAPADNGGSPKLEIRQQTY